MNIWNDPQDEDDLDPEYHPELDDRGAPPLEEPRQRPAQRPTAKGMRRIVEEEILPDPVEELLEELEDEEADHMAALSDARLRLEMGRLYEMVMQSNLFDNLAVDPQAVKNVQRQIKRFAKEQMEVMLGMRAAKEENTQIVSPFNEIEIDVLKKLAFTATKGASGAASTGPQKVQIAAAPVKEAPKKTALTPIGGTAPQKPVRKLEAKPAPIQRKAVPQPKKPVEESEALEKPVSEMSDEELAERNAEIARRQAQRRAAIPQDRLPPMSPESMNAMYTARVTHDKNSAAVSQIVDLLNKQ